jgi:AraC family transcriptional activator of pobA
MNEKVAEFSYELTADLPLKGFRAYELETKVDPAPSYNRRDCYKVCLLTGRTLLKYADKKIEAEGTYLFFGNPQIAYSSHVQGKMTGYACLFTEEFLRPSDHRSGGHPESPLFKLANLSPIIVDKWRCDFLSMLFNRIIEEQSTEYIYKDEIVRSCLSIIIQEAIKTAPADGVVGYKNAASRITFLFLEMLERQFPIDSVNDIVKLRSAQDYAQQLNVHVNYLNRSVKEVTGRPTTAHITDRVIAEAKALLHHTDWSVSDIAYALGFEYSTYFNKFFKKNTGAIPKSFRTYSLLGED